MTRTKAPHKLPTPHRALLSAWDGRNDPVEDLIGIMMVQLMPYDHLPIREQFSVLVNQAIVE